MLDVARDGSWAAKAWSPPPGPVFHLVLSLVALALLWASSTPTDGPFLVWLVSGAIVLGAAVLWGIWLLRWAIERRRGAAPAAARGTGWWFVVAPVGTIVLAGLLVGDVALRARWATSRDDFARLAAAAPPATEPGATVAFEVPARVGTYRVEGAERVGEAVVFHLTDGGDEPFLLDAGFVLAPDGPEDVIEACCEELRVEDLGGGWYAYTLHW